MTTATVLSGPADGVRRPLHAFGALLARDLRVVRRDLVGFAVRTVTQPLLFVFVFAYVLPRIHGGGAMTSGGGPSFATVLVPGLVASAIMMQGVMAVATPLVMELSYTKEIEDRVLAPLPMWQIGAGKIVSGALQGTVAALLVFPCVMVVHAPGQAPRLDLGRWPLVLLIVVLSSLFMASLGLLFGTIVEARRLASMFTIFMVPITMLGCVYYPWAELHSVRWLQILVLVNPLVYVSEALRGALVPGVPHLSPWAYLSVLVAGTAALGALSMRTLLRRLID